MKLMKIFLLNFCVWSFAVYASEVPLIEFKQREEKKDSESKRKELMSSNADTQDDCEERYCGGKDWLGNALVGMFSGVMIFLIPWSSILSESKDLNAVLKYTPEQDYCFSANVVTNDGELTKFACVSTTNNIGQLSASIEQMGSLYQYTLSSIMRVECDDAIRAQRCENSAQRLSNQRDIRARLKQKNRKLLNIKNNFKHKQR